MAPFVMRNLEDDVKALQITHCDTSAKASLTADVMPELRDQVLRSAQFGKCP
jgi:hypothetical protein